MKRQLAIPLVASFFLFCWIAPVEAQDTNVNRPAAALPVMPMSVTFRTVPFYFRESLAEDSPYSGIEALADTQKSEPWIEIVLTERGSGGSLDYCNLQRRVDSMTERGEEAYFVPIEFHSEQSANATRVFTFRFADNAGETVEWRVVLDSALPGANSKAGVIPQAERYGFVLASGIRSAAAPSASTLRIRKANAASTPFEQKNRAATQILYAAAVIPPPIHPGTTI